MNITVEQVELQTLRILRALKKPDDLGSLYASLQDNVIDSKSESALERLLALTNLIKASGIENHDLALNNTYQLSPLKALFDRDPSNPDVVFGYAMHLLLSDETERAKQLFFRLAQSRFRIRTLAKSQLDRLT